MLQIGLTICCGNTPKNKQKRWLDIGNISNYERWTPVPGLRKPYPCTPGLRNAILPDRKYYNIWEGPPLKDLTIGTKNRSGRGGPQNKIVVRHRGGRLHRRKVRLVDHARKFEDMEGIVERLEYDPGRSSFLALVRYPALDNEPQYIVAVNEMEPGDTVITTRNKRRAEYAAGEKFSDIEFDDDLVITRVQEGGNAEIAKILPGHTLYQIADTDIRHFEKHHVERFLAEQVEDFDIVVDRGAEGTFEFESGNAMPLRNCPDKAIVCCVESTPGKGATYARSAGTSCKILDKGATRDGYALLEMTSKEKRLVSLDSLATLGRVSNIYWNKVVWGRAGVRRRQGWRPTVCGRAMNAVDHPHGGGEGRKKTKAGGERTWKGKMAKGVPTRKKRWTRIPDWKNLIIQRRPSSVQEKSRAANIGHG